MIWIFKDYLYLIFIIKSYPLRSAAGSFERGERDISNGTVGIIWINYLEGEITFYFELILCWKSLKIQSGFPA